MRCKTPMTRVSEKGFSSQPSVPCWKRDSQYIKNPNKKIKEVRLSTFFQNTLVGPLLNLPIEKLMALPIANRKEGNTRSAKVKPNHWAWAKYGYISAPVPGEFTKIIRQMVKPRNTSNDKNRFGFWILLCFISILF